MVASSTPDDEALHGVSAEENIQGGNSDQSVESNTGATTGESPSSGTQDDNKPKDMASAVRAALLKGQEQSSGSGEGEGEAEADPVDPNKAKASTGETEEADDLTDEEFKLLKPKTQRRIKNLLKQTETLSAENAQLKPQAEKFVKVQQFADNAGLTKEDVNTGFNIMALMKNDPVAAREALEPIWNTLCEMVGDVLPADLREQVQKGQITEERALELSRLRAAQGLTAEQRKTQHEKSVKQDAQQQIEKLADSVGTAISAWEEKQQETDPDYSLKQGQIMTAIELECSKQLLLAKDGKPNTLPKSPEEAVALANSIKKKVDLDMQRFVPRKKPIKVVTGTGANSGSRPVAKSVYDAVAQAVGHS